MPEYAATIDRILDILKEYPGLTNDIAEWRFGHLPEQGYGNDFPIVYVTTAHTPEVERTDLGTSRGDDHDEMPGQRIVTEYWIIIITGPSGTPEDAQRALYSIQADVVSALKENLRLEMDGDKLSDFTTISSQNRLTSIDGKLVAGMTIMVRVTTHE